jgi:sugar transferase (PEP-CTERM system associated)
MSGRSFSPRTVGLILADAAILYGGIILALYLRLGFDGTIYQLNENNGWMKVTLATSVCLLLLYFYDLYDYTVMGNRRELLLRMIQALGIAWALLALLFYFAPPLLIGRGTSVYSVLITLVLLLLWRTLIHFLTGHPDIGEKILIVGAGQAAIDTAEAILKRRDAGYRIIGFVTEDYETVKMKLPEARVLGTTDNLEKIVHDEKIDRIVIAVRERRGSFPTEALLRMSLASNVSIEECTSFYERVTGQVHLDMLRPSWLIFAGRARDTRLKTVLRDSLHRLLALTGLIVSLPIAILTAILIKLDSRGEIFYRQERIGKNGRTFQVLKFRSMKTDAEADGKPIWAASDDERTTRVGRIIRKIRVDEIPQFWNIIKGEMSFIGPRPERPHFVAQLAEEVPFYEHRHLVAPGLTGWAQIKYPYGASVEDARQKLQYDLFYIKNQTLALDIIIVVETIKTVLFGRGGR